MTAGRDEAATSPSPTQRLPSPHASGTVPSPSLPQRVERLQTGTAPPDCPPLSLPASPDKLTFQHRMANDLAAPIGPHHSVQPRNGCPSRQNLPRAAPCRCRHPTPRGPLPEARLLHRATDYGRRDGATRRLHCAWADNDSLPRRCRTEAPRGKCPRPQVDQDCVDSSPMWAWSTINACGFAQSGREEPVEARLANNGEMRLQ